MKVFVTIILSLMLLISINGVLYLTYVFMAWDFNPGHWDTAGRTVGALLNIVLSSVAIGCMIEQRHS